MDPNPLDAPLSAWEALRPLLVQRLGIERVTSIEATFLDPRRMLAEPQTSFAAIAELRNAFSGGPLNEQELTMLVQAVPTLHAAIRQASAPMLDPARDAIVAIVRAAQSVVGPQAVAAAVAPYCQADALKRMIPPASEAALSDEFGFEHQRATVVRMLAKVAESFYKPMLRTALDLTWQARGESKTAPNLLRPLLEACKSAWTPDVYAALAEEQIVIVRNSEGHYHTTFDAAAKTITFANEKPDGTRVEVCLSDLEFGMLVHRFMRRCSSIHQGFAAA